MRKFTVGRLPNNDIIYQPDCISRLHADILVSDDGTITLVDHSTVGTVVNGVSVNNASRQIHYGDNVMFAGQIPLDWSLINVQPVQPMPQQQYIPTPEPQPYVPTEPQMAPNAIASLVLGILSLIGSYVGFIFGIIGLALANAGFDKMTYNPAGYKGVGMLKAGRICSIIGLVIWAVVDFILLIAIIAGA